MSKEPPDGFSWMSGHCNPNPQMWEVAFGRAHGTILGIVDYLAHEI